MSGMRGGMGRSRVGSADAEAQRAANAAAPKVPQLFRRISALFAPRERALVVTAALVILSAAISVLPPLLTQQAFDRGLFPTDSAGTIGPPDIPVLLQIVGLMVLLYLVSAAHGVWQTWRTANVGTRVM